MSLKKALLAATMFAAPALASAQPISGLYVGAGAGLNYKTDSDVTLSIPGSVGAARSGDAKFEIGYAALISLGYGFGNGVRAEVELSYRENSIDEFNGFGLAGGTTRDTGRVRNIGLMANALYDFNLGPNSPVIPYVGLGVGVVRENYEAVRVISRTLANTSVNVVGSSTTFAYQAIVGAAFPIAAVPGLAVTTEYRFLGALSDDKDADRYTLGVRTRGSAETDNYNHSLLVGVRYAFGQTPPPPVVAPVQAPAAAPAPARSFLVFFDFDRADLTDRARQIIAEAAQNAQRGGVTRLEVSGHADRSGTPQYNQRLSERRAQAVAAELERRGVARSNMAIQAFGESRPLVPTADGVREPQNRRVEIVLR
jgi:outer membrane protein OmpA-like peptidoglycan-associated protein